MFDIKAIDANALMTALHDVGGCDADPETWAAGYDAGIDLAIEMLKSQPTINPADIRPQGCWKEYWPGINLIMTGEEMLYRCSECDAKWGNVEGYRYCPYCGARMSRKENEDA